MIFRENHSDWTLERIQQSVLGYCIANLLDNVIENPGAPRPSNRTSNSAVPIHNYDAVFGGISLSRHAISLTKKPFPDNLLQLVSPDWVRVLCGPHIMQAIPLQRPLGWPSVLWSNFPAAEDAIASKQLDILSGGIAVPCVESHPNGCECSAAGLGGRTRSPDPPLWRESGPWQTNIPPVYAPFAFTPRPDSRMLGSWPR